MSLPMYDAQLLVKKIQSLPTERIAEVEDFVDFLQQRATFEQPSQDKTLDFPVISVGKWPNGLSLHREDMYGDDGR